jgi:hypothetical protein
MAGIHPCLDQVRSLPLGTPGYEMWQVGYNKNTHVCDRWRGRNLVWELLKKYLHILLCDALGIELVQMFTGV